MAEVNDAREAENMVRDLWSVGKPGMSNFDVHKQGIGWIVTYETLTVLGGVEEHEVHINAKTGKMLRKN